MKNRMIKTRTTKVKIIKNEEAIMTITMIKIIPKRVIMTIIIIILMLMRIKYKDITSLK